MLTLTVEDLTPQQKDPRRILSTVCVGGSQYEIPCLSGPRHGVTIAQEAYAPNLLLRF